VKTHEELQALKPYFANRTYETPQIQLECFTVHRTGTSHIYVCHPNIGKFYLKHLLI